MNIAIIGYGKMGHEIEKALSETKHKVVAIIDPTIQAGGNKFKEVSAQALKDADVCMDFSSPSVVVDTIKKVAALGKNMIIGTTGWYDKLEEVKKIVQEKKIGLVYAPNYSIGVNIFFKIVKDAAKMFSKFDSYDPFVIEEHHKGKADSPSGTAKVLGNIIIENIPRKKKAVYDKLDRKIADDELHVVSVRAGNLPGTHIVGFDSEADIIKLEHEAKGRRGFVLGAIMAAEWVNGKKGLHTIDDVMKEVVG